MIKITCDLGQNTPTESVGRTTQTDYFSLLIHEHKWNEFHAEHSSLTFQEYKKQGKSERE